MPGPSFEQDVRPLFREQDRVEMAFALDLWSYAEVRAAAEGVYDRLRDGTMPCDAAWPPERLALLRAWIDGGCPP